jgi:hypothetical protein
MLAAFETIRGATSAGCTVLRILWQIWVIPSGSVTASVNVPWGIVHTTASAFDAGFTAAARPYDDWMIYRNAVWPFVTTPAGGFVSPAFYESSDLRAKRKLDELDSHIFWCMSNANPQTVFFWEHSRILLAMP